jgi:hypothetical protein
MNRFWVVTILAVAGLAGTAECKRHDVDDYVNATFSANRADTDR